MSECAIYARVSTSEQVKGYSIGAQVEACRAHAAEQGWTVAAEYIDPGHSGGSDRRPAFQNMIRDGLAGKFSIILVHKFDRFARNRKHAITYKSLLREKGLQVISVSQPVDDSPSGILLEGIMEVFDEFFRINLRTETLKGQWRMIEQGLFPHKPPIGYEKDDGGAGWVRVTEAGEKLAFAFREFATGNYTLSTWADQAYTLGIRGEGGKRLSATAWSYIFNNRFYVGVLSWGGREAQGRHTPLVDQETFDRVKAVLQKNEPYRKKSYRFYLLRGLVWSVDGKSQMSGAVGKGYKYYRSLARTPAGQRHHILADTLEAQLVDVFQGVTVDPADVTGLIDLDDATLLALRVAPNVGAIYQWLETDDQRRAMCQLVIERYGLQVSGSNVVGLVCRSPFSYSGLVKWLAPPGGIELAVFHSKEVWS